MSTDLNNLPRIPDYVMACIHAYGDARADDDGTSGEHLRHAIEELRGWAGRAAAPAGGAEPVAVPEGWKLVLVNEGFDDLMAGLERSFRNGHLTDGYTADYYEAFDYRDAAPTAQPEPVVLFDDRPQNQRIAEAEERMRNPAPLQFEDESAQPEAPAEPSGDGWEDNAIYLLEHCPHAVRVREGGGPENLLSSLCVTFQKMQGLLATPAPAAQQPAELTDAARDVLAERARQISDERWTPEHDDEHVSGELAAAAACYALGGDDVPGPWPQAWDESWWRPSSDERRNLIKAGALILAEIERLDRAAIKAQGGSQ